MRVMRQVAIGQFNPTLNGSINAHVHGVADIGFIAPSYVFATPFLGGQAAVSVWERAWDRRATPSSGRNASGSC